MNDTILIRDNYLPEAAFVDLQEYCNELTFQIVNIGGKEFSTLFTPKYLYEFLQIDDHELILTFIRSAHKDFDTDLRIHADNIINGRKPSLAAVLYVNNPEDVSSNGTAFWTHHKYGKSLESNVSNEEFDRLLIEDANDESKWTKTDYVSNVPNRLLVYPSNYFHSKYPAKIENGVRKVLVCFYCKK